MRQPTTWQTYSPLHIILLLSFTIRLYLADWNSYWYDELLSVTVDGINHSTVWSMIDGLARNSVHPPLYHSILFFWMRIFGDTEASTRLLSNIYVTGAAFFVYHLTIHVYNQRTALLATLLFTFAHDSVYYSLETRNYAQTLFLCTLSSFLLYKYITIELKRNWFMALSLANLGMLLTHYYNGVFVVIQGVFVFLYLYHHDRKLNLIKPASIVLIPLALFFVFWGPTLLYRFNNPVGDGLITNPIIMFARMIFQNIAVPRSFLPLVLGIWIFTIIEVMKWVVKKQKLTFQEYFYIYLLLQILLIPIGAYIVSHYAHFVHRYIIYFVPHLLIFFAVIFEQALSTADRLFPINLSQIYTRHSLPIISLICLITVLPTGYYAANTPKEDWRDIAHEIAGIITNDPNNTYIVYETAPTTRNFMDYYFKRFDVNIRTAGNISRGITDKEDYHQAISTDAITQHDYLILFFIHNRLESFSYVMHRLCESYDYHFSDMTKPYNFSGKRGYVVFEVHGDEPNTCPDFLLL